MRLEDGRRSGREARCVHASDSITFLHLLEVLWADISREISPYQRIKKVSMTLFDLKPEGQAQGDLFNPLQPAIAQARDKAQRMSKALDILNQKYGRDTVGLGIMPTHGRGFSGTKIAFTRIPDIEEFSE